MSEPIMIRVTRQPFGDYFTIILPNGHTEELEPDPAREWFKERGANMDVIEKVLDHVWNFYRAEVTVENYAEPVMKKSKYSPDLDA